MNISVQTDEDQGIHHVTVDVGHTMRKNDRDKHTRDDIEAHLRERLKLDGYILIESPRQLFKSTGPHSGDFKFVQNKPAVKKVKKSTSKKAAAKAPASAKKKAPRSKKKTARRQKKFSQSAEG